MRNILNYLIAGAVGLGVYLYMTGFFDDGLPQCDSDPVKQLMIEVFDEVSKSKGQSVFAIDIRNVTERAANNDKGIRVCAASLYIGSKDSDLTTAFNVTYNVVWADKDQQLFRISNMQKAL